MCCADQISDTVSPDHFVELTARMNKSRHKYHKISRIYIFSPNIWYWYICCETNEVTIMHFAGAHYIHFTQTCMFINIYIKHDTVWCRYILGAS